MRKRIVPIMVAVALVLGGGIVATHKVLAEGWRKDGRARDMFGEHRSAHHFMRMLRALDLTDDQQAKARALLLEGRKNAITLRAELRVARLDLHQAFMQEEVDRSAVDEHVDRIGALQQQLLRQRIDMRLAMHDLLTPEQRAKARTLLTERLFDRSP